MDALIQDFRYSLRRLLKRPGFAFVVIATLGLGIGANTAIFSVVKSVLLAPLPYPAPDRVMMVWETKPALGRDRNVVNPQNYFDWRERNTTFQDLGLYTWITMTLTGGGHPEHVMGRAITPNVLDILGVHPALGRNFTREEGAPDAAMSVILSDGLWRRRFGALRRRSRHRWPHHSHQRRHRTGCRRDAANLPSAGQRAVLAGLSP
jgi:putative ABC transport system permease protein